jgi:hypothetical protein
VVSYNSDGIIPLQLNDNNKLNAHFHQNDRNALETNSWSKPTLN